MSEIEQTSRLQDGRWSHPISHRQIECLELAAKGFTSKEIARELGLSPSTIDNHIASAIDRLGAKNRTDAVERLNAFHARVGEAEPEASVMFGSPLSDEEAAILIDQLIGPAPEQYSEPTSKPKRSALPPIGGSKNDLGMKQRLFQIGQIALFAIMVAAAAILTIAGLVHVFAASN